VHSLMFSITVLSNTVNVVSLDISKAFDKANLYGLADKLVKRNIPRQFVALLINWYSNVSVCVKWNGVLSSMCNLFSGVRQGGVLSLFFLSICR